MLQLLPREGEKEREREIDIERERERESERARERETKGRTVSNTAQKLWVLASHDLLEFLLRFFGLLWKNGRFAQPHTSASLIKDINGLSGRASVSASGIFGGWCATCANWSPLCGVGKAKGPKKLILGTFCRHIS